MTPDHGFFGHDPLFTYKNKSYKPSEESSGEPVKSFGEIGDPWGTYVVELVFWKISYNQRYIDKYTYICVHVSIR